jgi:uncharacterized membrane protein YGL010W
MKTIQENLGQYATYHRDSRNIFTHFIGIPMIVLGVVILLSRPAYTLGGLPFSPAVWAVIASVIYYIKLDVRMGIVMGMTYAAMLWVGVQIAPLATSTWLAWGIGLFVIGWIIQFVGHYFEGRKPAFMDDITGLAIGPLFVAAELAFLLGLRRDLEEAVERSAGVVKRK